MNVWTDIAIGNLQRRRGPPLEIDPDTDELRDMSRIVCLRCGDEKPETEFYLKRRRDGTEYRSKVCRTCTCANERATRVHKPRPIPHREVILYLLEKEPMTLAELAKTMGISRRTVHKNVMQLLGAGRVFFYENRSSKYNPTIPTFWIRPKTNAGQAPAERIQP